MSDIEEPPEKMSKYEYLEEGSADDGMDDGQEEWLSDGILTDDEYPAANQTGNDWKASDNSQDTTLPSTNCDSAEHLENTLESQDNVDLNTEETSSKTVEHNIEETLNNLDSKKCVSEGLPDELNAFLIRKADGQVLQEDKLKSLTEVEQDNENDPKQVEDDGNDTDELLRMLSEDNNKVKKMTKTIKDMGSSKDGAQTSDEDDDSEIFETATAKSLKLAKNALIKKYQATKAVPEDMSDEDETDASSDEVDTMKKMFGVKKLNVAAKSTAKSSITVTEKKPVPKHAVNNSKAIPNKLDSPQATSQNSSHKTITPKSILRTGKSSNTPDTNTDHGEVRTRVTYKPTLKTIRKPDSTVHGTKKLGFLGSMEKITLGSSMIKPSGARPTDFKVRPVASESRYKPADIKVVPPESKVKPAEVRTIPTKVKAAEVKMVQSADIKTKDTDSKMISDLKVRFADGKGKLENARLNSEAQTEPDEIINEDEFLEEDDIDLDEEEFAEDSDMEEDGSRSQQRIMRPERMDEEVPTDGESHSEDGSLYDELPSSESDDMEDFFALDIRAERAGDYIPLLGSKARELLLEEKQRVTARLINLRQSLTALTESGRRQAEQLRDATISLAELDDMLKAS